MNIYVLPFSVWRPHPLFLAFPLLGESSNILTKMSHIRLQLLSCNYLLLLSDPPTFIVTVPILGSLQPETNSKLSYKQITLLYSLPLLDFSHFICLLYVHLRSPLKRLLIISQVSHFLAYFTFRLVHGSLLFNRCRWYTAVDNIVFKTLQITK